MWFGCFSKNLQLSRNEGKHKAGLYSIIVLQVASLLTRKDDAKNNIVKVFQMQKRTACNHV